MTTEPKSMRVVVADDDAFTVSLVSGGLRARGFTVATAASVAEASATIATKVARVPTAARKAEATKGASPLGVSATRATEATRTATQPSMN